MINIRGAFEDSVSYESNCMYVCITLAETRKRYKAEFFFNIKYLHKKISMELHYVIIQGLLNLFIYSLNALC